MVEWLDVYSVVLGHRFDFHVANEVLFRGWRLVWDARQITKTLDGLDNCIYSYRKAVFYSSACKRASPSSVSSLDVRWCKSTYLCYRDSHCKYLRFYRVARLNEKHKKAYWLRGIRWDGKFPLDVTRRKYTTTYVSGFLDFSTSITLCVLKVFLGCFSTVLLTVSTVWNWEEIERKYSVSVPQYTVAPTLRIAGLRWKRF